ADKDDGPDAETEKTASRFSGTVERTAKTVLDVVSEAADVAAEAIRNAVGGSKGAAETKEEEEKPKTDE
ncbi:MAG: hypothetical protein LBS24_06690, partial [Clostridiales Family XIII bacterium]|nr:hypothetical protein [Clostridiales Family XIII bacterium]